MLTANEIRLRFDASIGTSSVVSPFVPGQQAHLNERARPLRGELQVPRGGSAFGPVTLSSVVAAPPRTPPQAAQSTGESRDEAK